MNESKKNFLFLFVPITLLEATQKQVLCKKNPPLLNSKGEQQPLTPLHECAQHVIDQKGKQLIIFWIFYFVKCYNLRHSRNNNTSKKPRAHS